MGSETISGTSKVFRGVYVLAALVGTLFFAIGGLVFHVWTCHVFYQHWGTLWGIVMFFLPAFAEIIAAVACCFWWHQWYYILAIAALLVSMGGQVFGKDIDHPSRGMIGACLAWFCVFALTTGGFFYTAASHGFGPTTSPAVNQDEADEVGAAAARFLAEDMSGDPQAMAEAASSKSGLKDRLSAYNPAYLTSIRESVDKWLLYQSSVEIDVFRPLVDGSKPKASDDTKRRLHALSEVFRAHLQEHFPDDSEIDGYIEKQTSGIPRPISEELAKQMKDAEQARWKLLESDYTQLFGQHPPQELLDEQKIWGRNERSSSAE